MNLNFSVFSGIASKTISEDIQPENSIVTKAVPYKISWNGQRVISDMQDSIAEKLEEALQDIIYSEETEKELIRVMENEGIDVESLNVIRIF